MAPIISSFGALSKRGFAGALSCVAQSLGYYCVGDDVYDNYQNADCSLTPTFIESCLCGCMSGACNSTYTPGCSSNYCIGSSVYQDCTADACVAPSPVEQLVCECGCTGGVCNPTYTPGCGVDYCIGDDVYADCTANTCLAPTATLQEVCTYGCTSGVCDPSPLGDCWEVSAAPDCTIYFNDSAGAPTSVFATSTPVYVCASASNPAFDDSGCGGFTSIVLAAANACYVDGDC